MKLATIIDPASHEQECDENRCTMSLAIIFIILKISPESIWFPTINFMESLEQQKFTKLVTTAKFLERTT